MPDNRLSSTEETQKQYYDRIASEYDVHYSNRYALQYKHALYAGILEGIVELEGRSVLDAMCGGGQAAALFLALGAHVTGIDISQEQCDLFAARYPQAGIVCGSILKTDFADATFDLVATDSLHHLHPAVDQGIAEIARILKPGGYFLFWEPSARSIMDGLRRLWYRLDKTYFEANEQSIDLDVVMRTHGRTFRLVRRRFGGNLAYLLVQESLLLRIPPGLVKLYAPPLLYLENLLGRLQTRSTSCWVLALLQKKGA